MRTTLLPFLLVFLTFVWPAAGQSESEQNPPPASGESEDQAEERQEATLDELFAQLAHQTSTAGANRIARQIWAKWNESGSATVDLLMGWAGEAIREKKYTVAEELLTQVTVLVPEYAEAWNRRATMFYLKNDFGRSIADIERTLQLEPRHFGALSGLGIILQRTGLDEKALEAWYRVLAIYPANAAAQKAVVEIEEKLAGQSL
jgi:tetratricopeptide (TPR) repeat protein